jgi:hypothetical protein
MKIARRMMSPAAPAAVDNGNTPESSGGGSKDEYSNNDIKLKGRSDVAAAYDVVLPRGVRIGLTKKEQLMIERKEAAEAAAEALRARAEGGEGKGVKLSDVDILEAEMAAMLDRMRTPPEGE